MQPSSTSTSAEVHPALPPSSSPPVLVTASPNTSEPTTAAPSTPSTPSASDPSTMPPMTSTFPFLDLPLELRLQIYDYLLPHTYTVSPLTLRRSAGAAEPAPPISSPPLNAWNIQSEFETPPSLRISRLSTTSSPSCSSPGANIIWQRGCTKLLLLCKQIHEECAEVMYGGNTFVVRVSGDSDGWGVVSGDEDVGVRFAYRFNPGWSTGAEFSGTRDLLTTYSARTLGRIRHFVVVIEAWVESVCYGGWKGRFGMQVALLRKNVDALVGVMVKGREDGRGEMRSLHVHIATKGGGGLGKGMGSPAAIAARLAASNKRRGALLDVRAAGGPVDRILVDPQERMQLELQTVLEPFWHLEGVGEARVTGSGVSEEVAEALVECVMAPGNREASRVVRVQRGLARSGRPLFGEGLREAGGRGWLEESVL